MARRVKVKIPASSANLGPGFDSLGLALGLYNTVELEVIPLGEGLDVDVRGIGADDLPRDDSNLVVRAFNDVARSAGYGPTGLYVRTTNDIPLSAGLGSSSTAIVGGLAGANALLELQLSREEILQRASRIEGHPDNVAAAIYGGLTLVSASDAEVHVKELPVSDSKVVVVTPDISVSTAAARAALPTHIPFHDATYNISHALFVVQALQTGDFDTLAWAMDDRLHQPYRKQFITGYDAVAASARKAGAAAVTISGAGPSMAAFASARYEAIAKAMREAFAAHGVASQAFILPVDRQGVQISVLR